MYEIRIKFNRINVLCGGNNAKRLMLIVTPEGMELWDKCLRREEDKLRGGKEQIKLM